MDLPKVRGRLLRVAGRAVLGIGCPMCGEEHRYDKGPAGGPEAEELLARGYSDEWLPCRVDLPGNFCRVLVNRSDRRRTGRARPRADR